AKSGEGFDVEADDRGRHQAAQNNPNIPAHHEDQDTMDCLPEHYGTGLSICGSVGASNEVQGKMETSMNFQGLPVILVATCLELIQ
ncbi:MAG: hypothetical protein H7Y43_13955, partial [Akkermansiaceae bacterium]|nr:hypothetical protein [Verrucomicrobiales bacterium]